MITCWAVAGQAADKRLSGKSPDVLNVYRRGQERFEWGQCCSKYFLLSQYHPGQADTLQSKWWMNWKTVSLSYNQGTNKKSQELQNFPWDEEGNSGRQMCLKHCKVLNQVAAHDPQMQPWTVLPEVASVPDKIFALEATSQSMLSGFQQELGQGMHKWENQWL